MTDQDFPSVSVAIITYNQREFLRECIDSILNQDYSNFEIVVADDASTDGTQDMLREYDRKHPGKFVLKLGEKIRVLLQILMPRTLPVRVSTFAGWAAMTSCCLVNYPNRLLLWKRRQNM